MEYTVQQQGGTHLHHGLPFLCAVAGPHSHLSPEGPLRGGSGGGVLAAGPGGVRHTLRLGRLRGRAGGSGAGVEVGVGVGLRALGGCEGRAHVLRGVAGGLVEGGGGDVRMGKAGEGFGELSCGKWPWRTWARCAGVANSVAAGSRCVCPQAAFEVSRDWKERLW